MEDQRTSLYLYASTYSRLPITEGTRYLTFRDVPGLVKKFVSGTKTLDYGCGPGHSTTFLKSLGLDVEGVDINPYMISFSKELDPTGTYTVINSGEIPTKNLHYDLVYAGFVLPYIGSKSEMVGVVKEIARVLKQDGTFIALVPSDNFYKYKWLVEDNDYEENVNTISGSLKKSKLGDLTLFHYCWKDEDYRDIITTAGLDIVCTCQPLGRDSDAIAWVNETKVGPSTIYVAKKNH